MSHKNFRAIYTNRDENFYSETKFDETKINFKDLINSMRPKNNKT